MDICRFDLRVHLFSEGFISDDGIIFYLCLPGVMGFNSMEEKMEAARNKQLIRVAITGPESTGKSILTESLSRYFNFPFVREYAREYINKLDRPYTFEDVEAIAYGQTKQEKQLASSADTLCFSDTELLVIKVWMEHKYKKFPEWIKEKIVSDPFDLYLLCNVDMPWESDPQREHPNLREYFFSIYEQELKKYDFNYRVISGNYEKRFLDAVQYVEELLR